MDGSIAAGTEKGPNETNLPKISDSSSNEEPTAPREVVREVAASLGSLAKVLPYEEFAAIVHHIARLRWRCGGGPASSNSPKTRNFAAGMSLPLLPLGTATGLTEGSQSDTK